MSPLPPLRPAPGAVEVRRAASVGGGGGGGKLGVGEVWYAALLEDALPSGALACSFEGGVWPEEVFPARDVRPAAAPQDPREAELFEPEEGDTVEVAMPRTALAPSSWRLARIERRQRGLLLVVPVDARGERALGARQEIMLASRARPRSISRAGAFVGHVQKAELPIDPLLSPWLAGTDVGGPNGAAGGAGGLLGRVEEAACRRPLCSSVAAAAAAGTVPSAGTEAGVSAAHRRPAAVASPQVEGQLRREERGGGGEGAAAPSELLRVKCFCDAGPSIFMIGTADAVRRAKVLAPAVIRRQLQVKLWEDAVKLREQALEDRRKRVEGDKANSSRWSDGGWSWTSSGGSGGWWCGDAGWQATGAASGAATAGGQWAASQWGDGQWAGGYEWPAPPAKSLWQRFEHSFEAEEVHVGRIIGKQRANLELLRRKFNVDVSIEPRKEGAAKQLITVSGDDEKQVQEAVRRTEVVAEAVEVEPDKMAWVAGHKYETIKEIAKSACLHSFSLNKAASKLEYTGSRYACEIAKELFRAHFMYHAVFKELDKLTADVVVAAGH